MKKLLQFTATAALLLLVLAGAGYMITAEPEEGSYSGTSGYTGVRAGSSGNRRSGASGRTGKGRAEGGDSSGPRIRYKNEYAQSGEAEEVPVYKYDKGYIFLGDSRFYLMNQDCGIEAVGNFFVVACPGMGYEWMISEALAKAEAIRSAHPEIRDWVVISGLGINDMENVDSYINTYQELSSGITLMLVSVNPTMGRAEPEYSNDSIDAFNKRLQDLTSGNPSIGYINSHDYLMEKGYWMTDGIHYQPESNQDIYQFILNSIGVRF